MSDGNLGQSASEWSAAASPCKEKEHSMVTRLLAWRCHVCPPCRYARAHPDTLFAKALRLHGKFCPFWRAHEKVYGE